MPDYSVAQANRARIAEKAVRLLSCPFCGSVPGEPCRTMRGGLTAYTGPRTYAGYVHKPREAPLLEEFRLGRESAAAGQTAASVTPLRSVKRG